MEIIGVIVGAVIAALAGVLSTVATVRLQAREFARRREDAERMERAARAEALATRRRESFAAFMVAVQRLYEASAAGVDLLVALSNLRLAASHVILEAPEVDFEAVSTAVEQHLIDIAIGVEKARSRGGSPADLTTAQSAATAWAVERARAIV